MNAKIYFAEIQIHGKQIAVSMFESREDCNGHVYYARCDGITSRQKKRVIDWASDKPICVRTLVLNSLR